MNFFLTKLYILAAFLRDAAKLCPDHGSGQVEHSPDGAKL